MCVARRASRNCEKGEKPLPEMPSASRSRTAPIGQEAPDSSSEVKIGLVKCRVKDDVKIGHMIL